MAGVAKLAREKAKKVSLHNRKPRDCRIHYNDTVKQNAKTEDRRELSSIFITEGDSASGTITKVRNAETQAVFSLRGKPLNSYGMTRKLSTKTASSISCRPHSTSKRESANTLQQSDHCH